MNPTLFDLFRKMLSFLAILALIYLVLCLLLYFQQRSLIYQPQPRTVIDGSTMLTLRVDSADVLVTTAPRPGARALFADAVALFDKVHAEHPSVLVIGRSLGSGVATYLASVRPVARLVLVTPYDSLVAVAARHYSLFPVRWLMRDRFESWRYAAMVTAPTIILAAEYDEVIPATNTKALLAHFRPGVASMKVIGGTSHNSISESADYLPLLSGQR